MCDNANKNIVVRYSRPKHIKSIIDNVISGIKEKEGGNKKGKIEEYIKKALGKQSREHIKVHGLRKGSLCVNVNNSAWLQELSLMKQDLISSINEEFKGDLVKEIRIKLVRE